MKPNHFGGWQPHDADTGEELWSKTVTIRDGGIGIPESAEAHAERVRAAERFESLLKSGAIPMPAGSVVLRDGPVVWVLPELKS